MKQELFAQNLTYYSKYSKKNLPSQLLGNLSITEAPSSMQLKLLPRSAETLALRFAG